MYSLFLKISCSPWGSIALLLLVISSCTLKSDETLLRNDTSETLWVEVVPPSDGFRLLFDHAEYHRNDSFLVQRKLVYWQGGMAFADHTLDTLEKLDYPGEDTSIVMVGTPGPMRVELAPTKSTDSLLVFALYPGGDFSLGSGSHRWVRWGAQVPIFWEDIRLLDQHQNVLWTFSKRNLRRLFRTRIVSTFRSGGSMAVYSYVFHWLPKN